MSGNNTSDLFSQLLSNPAALSGIASLLSSVQKGEADRTDDPKAFHDGNTEVPGSSEPGATSADSSGMGDMLGMLLSNPQILGALPSVLSAISGMSAASAPQGMPQSPFSSLLPTPAPPRVTDRRSALLLALKPYMPKEKCDVIDTVVRIIEIMSLIK